MLQACRVFGIFVIIVLIFHTVFVLLNLNDQPKSTVSGDMNVFRSVQGTFRDYSTSSVNIDKIEHHERIYHLNKTLSLLNHDLHMLNETLHDQVKRLSQKQSLDLSVTHGITANIRETASSILSKDKSIIDSPRALDQPRKIYPRRKALLFTMDSISSYETAAHHGGAAGEIIIRRALEDAFLEFNVQLELIRSDQEFESKRMIDYEIVILDPWTWAAKGWVPKANIRGYDHKIFIMDFFGSPKLRGSGLNISPKRVLTAFGSPWNTFLGYYIRNADKINIPKKLNQGVIWGKDIKHFEGHHDLIRHVSSMAPLIATISPIHADSRLYGNVQWLGHQSMQQWSTLLAQSKFLLGLGNPLIGPSAIDAIAHGCMYINPIYSSPVRDVFHSQHPYAQDKIGEPYVCSYHIDNQMELSKCVEKAMTIDLKSFIPKDFTKEAYFQRVEDIFLNSYKASL